MEIGTDVAEYAPGHYYAIASVNVGLPTSAFKGKHRLWHATRIEQLVIAAMSTYDVLGIAFCEVGNSFDGLHGEDKELFENAIRSGISKAGYKKAPDIFFAPQSAFVIVLRGDIQICDHGMLEKLTSRDPRRNAQWLDFICPDASREFTPAFVR